MQQISWCSEICCVRIPSGPSGQLPLCPREALGADGTEGIGKLRTSRKTYVIAQDQETSIVFGMPKSIIAAGLADQVVPLDQIAQEIILHVGVN